MSSMRGSDGSPCTVSSKYVAFSLDLHWPVSNSGTLTQGVLIGCSGTTHGWGGVVPTIVRPSFERYACRVALPPARAAGFVHAATIPGSVTFPNRVLAGGGIVERNDTYVITQPVCVAEWQRETC